MKKTKTALKTISSTTMTRRELVTHISTSFAGALIAPKWMNLLLGPSAFAIEKSQCQTRDGSMPAFVHIHAVGGWNPSANWVHRANEVGDLLSSYNTMSNGKSPATTKAFSNNALFMSGGQWLPGVQSKANPTVLGKTSFIGISNASNQDSPTNQFGMAGMLSAAGLIGSLLPFLGQEITGQNTQSGGFFVPSKLLSTPPLRVSSFDTISSSIGLTGKLGQNLSAKQKGSIAKLVRRLSTEQAEKLTQIKEGGAVKDLITCAGFKIEDLSDSSNAGIDPRGDGSVNSIWGINTNTPVSDNSVVQASLVYNALKENASGAILNIPNYDYHGLTRAQSDDKDKNLGALIGSVLSTAAAMNKPVFINLTTDGDTLPSPSDVSSEANGDTSLRGGLYCLYYNPAGARPVKGPENIGWYTEAQMADTTAYGGMGGNPALASVVVFLNYLSAGGLIDVDGASSASMAKYKAVFSSSSASGLDEALIKKVVKIGRV